MLRRSEKDSRHSQTCSCLLEAYRNFPAEAGIGKGCASPNCPVRTLDGITLHQFLEAIGDGGCADAGEARAEDGGETGEITIFRHVARRRKRRKSRREPD